MDNTKEVRGYVPFHDIIIALGILIMVIGDIVISADIARVNIEIGTIFHKI